MNSNAPLFKKVFKVARHFNRRPQFLDYNEKMDKVFLRDYRKGSYDEPNLIFIGCIPLTIMVKAYLNKAKLIEDNILFDKKLNSFILIGMDGEVKCIIKDNILCTRDDKGKIQKQYVSIPINVLLQDLKNKISSGF